MVALDDLVAHPPDGPPDVVFVHDLGPGNENAPIRGRRAAFSFGQAGVLPVRTGLTGPASRSGRDAYHVASRPSRPRPGPGASRPPRRAGTRRRGPRRPTAGCPGGSGPRPRRRPSGPGGPVGDAAARPGWPRPGGGGPGPTHQPISAPSAAAVKAARPTSPATSPSTVDHEVERADGRPAGGASPSIQRRAAASSRTGGTPVQQATSGRPMPPPAPARRPPPRAAGADRRRPAPARAAAGPAARRRRPAHRRRPSSTKSSRRASASGEDLGSQARGPRGRARGSACRPRTGTDRAGPRAAAAAASNASRAGLAAPRSAEPTIGVEGVVDAGALEVVAQVRRGVRQEDHRHAGPDGGDHVDHGEVDVPPRLGPGRAGGRRVGAVGGGQGRRRSRRTRPRR